ncbi:spore protein [Clostridium sp. MF28]|uniref:alpha/beta-type small acid-soluble spore protein n=1 Tax=Clostridium TaxID=1485 RepID=UPI000CF88325|nr:MULTISPECIES: alpha/beta-type small acid-soluble spore protein [Clostridium]AVK51195.1 spore protein [Clostridium sp. MF28]PSM55205.1 acid-soluble spore protein [Clostridium diolis]
MASSSSGRNTTLIPEAKPGVQRLKTEAASEIGLSDYENIDKGNLSSRDNGRIGGEMVKRMIESYEQEL